MTRKKENGVQTVRTDWEEAIGRAVAEKEFRARLLRNPADALRDYGLREHERVELRALRVCSLNQLITQLRRLDVATGERRN